MMPQISVDPMNSVHRREEICLDILTGRREEICLDSLLAAHELAFKEILSEKMG